MEDLSIANDAGPGSAVGQAIAAYVDAEKAVFRRVRLLGNQDTLFCAPLPEAEREKDGFLGPRKFAPAASRRSITRAARSRGHRLHLWRGRCPV